MFEKASEEYGKMISEGMQIEKGSITSYTLSSAILGFKDGANFGYKTANEWHFDKIGIKKNCLCCGKEMKLKLDEERDFCNRCFPIVCQEVFNRQNDRLTVEELKEKIKGIIEE